MGLEILHLLFICEAGTPYSSENINPLSPPLLIVQNYEAVSGLDNIHYRKWISYCTVHKHSLLEVNNFL
ncbi:MAG: hypothetical protein GX921_07155 [Bacteroidales bacterium]|nr:hypothetical protein [Bacteroidales bacterium]